MIAPHFEELAKEHTSIRFVHIDIDEAREDMTKELSEIRAVPTFWIYKKGERVHSFAGGNLVALKESVAMLAKKEEKPEKPDENKESTAVKESETKAEGTCKILINYHFESNLSL